MDINLNYSDDDNPLALKADFILSLCDIVVGSKDGLQPVEKTVIDRAVRNVYRPYLADPVPEKMPSCKTSMMSCSASRSRRPREWRQLWSCMSPAH